MIEAGEQVYDEHCANCHGVKLRSTGAMPDLKDQKADGRARFDQIVMSGKNQMRHRRASSAAMSLTSGGPTFGLVHLACDNRRASGRE
jgi:mono/diheme cytochrome c family protein